MIPFLWGSEASQLLSWTHIACSDKAGPLHMPPAWCVLPSAVVLVPSCCISIVMRPLCSALLKAISVAAACAAARRMRFHYCKQS